MRAQTKLVSVHEVWSWRRLAELTIKIGIRGGEQPIIAQIWEQYWSAHLTLGKKANKRSVYSKRVRWADWLTGSKMSCLSSFRLVGLQGLYCGWSAGWWMCTLTTSWGTWGSPERPVTRFPQVRALVVKHNHFSHHREQVLHSCYSTSNFQSGKVISMHLYILLLHYTIVLLLCSIYCKWWM